MNEGVSNVKDFESYEIGLRVCSKKQGTACPPMKIGICVCVICDVCGAWCGVGNGRSDLPTNVDGC